MCSITISENIKHLLDNVIDSGNAQKEARQAVVKASQKYQTAQDVISAYLHEEAGKCDQVANHFFTEEGVLYRGQLFQFDDEGELTVVDGPSVVEVG
ncbi:hypothetical protein ACEV90_13350 [Vibrio parahaemolyticus]